LMPACGDKTLRARHFLMSKGFAKS